jgi:hypothetical protein
MLSERAKDFSERKESPRSTVAKDDDWVLEGERKVDDAVDVFRSRPWYDDTLEPVDVERPMLGSWSKSAMSVTYQQRYWQLLTAVGRCCGRPGPIPRVRCGQ